MTEPREKNFRADLLCFIMSRDAGLCFSTYLQIATAMSLLLSGSECSIVMITLAPADEAFGIKKRAMNS